MTDQIRIEARTRSKARSIIVIEGNDVYLIETTDKIGEHIVARHWKVSREAGAEYVEITLRQ